MRRVSRHDGICVPRAGRDQPSVTNDSMSPGQAATAEAATTEAATAEADSTTAGGMGTD
jgi:hypothetical protein